MPTQASDGYGVNANVHNLRVFSDYEGNEVNKRKNNVNKKDMGIIGWFYYDNCFIGPIADMKQNVGVVSYANAICGRYNQKVPNSLDDNHFAVWNAGNQIRVKDSSYNGNATAFKTAMTGEPLYYELDDTSKTETDLDSFDYFFDVEEGDTITFNNTYAQQVYATYSFITKEVKSNE